MATLDLSNDGWPTYRLGPSMVPGVTDAAHVVLRRKPQWLEAVVVGVEAEAFPVVDVQVTSWGFRLVKGVYVESNEVPNILIDDCIFYIVPNNSFGCSRVHCYAGSKPELKAYPYYVDARANFNLFDSESALARSFLKHSGRDYMSELKVALDAEAVDIDATLESKHLSELQGSKRHVRKALRVRHAVLGMLEGHSEALQTLYTLESAHWWALCKTPDEARIKLLTLHYSLSTTLSMCSMPLPESHR